MFAWLKTEKCDFLGAIFVFLSHFTLWSRSLKTIKFCMKVVALNMKLHFKFFFNPSIFGIVMNKKLIFSWFTGPFWAFLGTPTNTHHHDSFWFSLLHQEEFPLTNFWCWDLIKVKILTKNTQKWPFWAFLVFTMSFRTVISQPFLGNICWNFFWNLYRCSKYYFKKSFWV